MFESVAEWIRKLLGGNSASGADRRRHPRFPSGKRSSLMYRDGTGPHSKADGKIANISVSGFLFVPDDGQAVPPNANSVALVIGGLPYGASIVRVTFNGVHGQFNNVLPKSVVEQVVPARAREAARRR